HSSAAHLHPITSVLCPNSTPTPQIYSLSLHDALPIFKPFIYLAALEAGYRPNSILLDSPIELSQGAGKPLWRPENYTRDYLGPRSEEHTSELQSRENLVCRLLLEKKKNIT